MRVDFLDINTQRSLEDKMRFCFFIYVFLYVFEGAIRKWILPVGIGNAMLLARDPIVLYVFFSTLNTRYSNSKYLSFFVFFSIVSLFTTLLFGHSDVATTYYGIRIYLFHIPCSFIWANILRKSDIIILGKILVIFSVINCLVLGTQYYSPQTSWINRGLGGDESGSGFAGVGDFFRPSGFFSFTSGNTGHTQLTACFFAFFLMNGNVQWEHKYQLLVMLVFFIISVFFCLSRHTIASVIVLILWCITLSSVKFNKMVKSSIFVFLIGGLLFVLYSHVPVFSKSVDVIMKRFENASQSEGGFIEGSVLNRFAGSYIRAFSDTQNFSEKEIPWFGFGVGAASNVGTRLLGLNNRKKFGLAEEPWSQVICENGYFLGGILLIIGRLFLALVYSLRAFVKYYKTHDVMPVCFVPFAFDSIMNLQIGVSTALGLFVITLTVMVKGCKYGH